MQKSSVSALDKLANNESFPINYVNSLKLNLYSIRFKLRNIYF